eukprot:750154-Hanusia_phi.AAC.1
MRRQEDNACKCDRSEGIHGCDICTKAYGTTKPFHTEGTHKSKKNQTQGTKRCTSNLMHNQNDFTAISQHRVTMSSTAISYFALCPPTTSLRPFLTLAYVSLPYPFSLPPVPRILPPSASR